MAAMLVDQISLTLKAGHGGAGRVSFFPRAKAGPDGGNGGRGGDLYIQTTTDLTALRSFRRDQELSGGNGTPGERNKKSGKKGEDRTVFFPIGSVLLDKTNHQTLELELPNQTILFCKGGLGGLGNAALAHSRRTTPKYAQPGRAGEEKKITISLKLIADFGIIGLPNAGKSSLLNALTKSQAKVGDYPFTTLEPNLGTVNGKILADIPGLIEGASLGKGLGTKFLKHIEKTHTLLHCLDGTSRQIAQDYLVVVKELKAFSPLLVKKQEIILITKADLLDEAKKIQIKQLFLKKRQKVIFVSIYDQALRANLGFLFEPPKS